MSDLYKQALDSFLKNKKFKEYLYEGLPEVNYKVSTGSLILDSELGGGIGPGATRFTGGNESGKTNAALTVMLNMIGSGSRKATVKGSRGLYVMAEGRLSEEMRVRSGLVFVDSMDRWEEGTCYVLRCNVFEPVFDFIRSLLKASKVNGKQLCILIDSMDGLIPEAALEQSSADASKVAAGALLTSDFLKRISLGMSTLGHMCLLLSQVRSTIKISQYQKSDPNNTTSATGGNALGHYASLILEFIKPNKGRLILQNENVITIDKNNRPIGHYACVDIKKSTNEKTNLRVEYPVKYGRKNGTSNWLERELIDLCLDWEIITKNSTWFLISDEKLEGILKKYKGDEAKDKYQGINKLYAIMEGNYDMLMEIKDYLLNDIIHLEI